MESRVIGPGEFGKMLGVSDKTAAAHMRNQRECLNVATGTKHQYLRLPLWVAEEIVSGKRPLTPFVEKAPKAAKPRTVSTAKAARAKTHEPLYVKKR